MLHSLFSLVNMSLQSLGSNQRNYAEIQITIEPEFSVIAQLKVILIIEMIGTKITMMQLDMKLKIWVFVMVRISAWTWSVTIQSCIWRWFISVLVKIKMSSIFDLLVRLWARTCTRSQTGCQRRRRTMKIEEWLFLTWYANMFSFTFVSLRDWEPSISEIKYLSMSKFQKWWQVEHRNSIAMTVMENVICLKFITVQGWKAC